jgi:hypothetical protein
MSAIIPLLSKGAGAGDSRAWLSGALRPAVDHYKRTLVATQTLIAAVTVAVLWQSHRLVAALLFLAMMQAGAVLGAIWAARLKEKIARARRETVRARA